MLSALVLALAARATTPDWPAVSLAASRYAATTSESLAGNLLNLLPARRLEPEERPPEEVVEQLYQLLPVIAPRLDSGDSPEIRLAFRLIYVSDGAFSEELLALLGGLASHHPEKYLSELLRVRPGLSQVLDPIRSVTFIGPELGSQETLSELRSRERGLRKVVTKKLLPLRDECLGLLEQELRTVRPDGVKRN
jgi:hypothetical protein